MTIFFQVVLPVLLIFLSGFGLQKWKKLDIRSVSTVGLYVLTPCLVFRTFYKTDMNVQYLNIVVFSLILLLILLLINKIYARIRQYPSSVESGFILATAFMNSGNYGAPIVLFAYGSAGFDYSVSILVIHAIIMNFFGVYYAARGQAGVKTALKSVMEMPPTYALIIALAFQWLQVEVPENIFAVIDLLGQATIPLVMVVLGMQLAQIELKQFQWDKITYRILLRMLVSPVIAYLIIQFYPMDPLLEKVLILSAAMPTAATTALYALQFNTEPELVSSVTLMTTLVSIVSITVLLGILN